MARGLPDRAERLGQTVVARAEGGGRSQIGIFHSVLSLYSVIGLFLLLGIVKKNGIMVVDFALQRIDEGWDLRSAIHEASVERFRPIMMTTLAALMGAIPIALGFGQDAASRRPLGLVIVGGLIFSQLVTLFVTPVIYLWVEWFRSTCSTRCRSSVAPTTTSTKLSHHADRCDPSQ